MKNNRMKGALENIAHRGVPENRNLWPEIESRLKTRSSFMQTLRARPVMVITIVVLALLLLTGVVYAIGKSLGYIPGIGVVDQSVPIRVLAEPVTVEQQGISVTVSKVVADSTRTFMSYSVDAIPGSYCKIPEMYLPDGTNLEQTCCSGPQSEYYYSPIPNGTNNVTVALFCGFFDGGAPPESFRLSLNLVPAPAGYATPAVEIAVTADGVENKTGLHLEKVIELADSYILIGKFTDGGDLSGPLSMSTESDTEYLPHIEDANGNPVSFKVREDSRPDPDWDVAYYWAYEIPKPVATPLKITVDRVNIRKHNTAQIQFDTGDHPQVGQEWNLNLPVKLGASDFVVDSVTFLGNGYTFNLSSENLPEGVEPNIDIVDSSLSPYLFDNISPTTISAITITTKSPPPTGNLTVNWWLDEFIPQPGPWSLIWTPPNPNP